MATDEYDTYLETLDEIEDRISDDSKFPVIEDGKMKMLCKLIFEFIKMILNYLKYHIVDATKKES
jgi:hypothetical protein